MEKTNLTTEDILYRYNGEVLTEIIIPEIVRELENLKDIVDKRKQKGVT